ncbi:MAG: type VI secretion system baseplate subunit TssE [Bryobacteraceae bacterium]
MEPGNQFDQLRRQPRPLRGLDAPLFDRLLGGGPVRSGPPPETGPGGPAATVASIERELSRLFNTRLAPRRSLDPVEAATVTGFGVPDWSAVNPASAGELRALSEALAAQARAFEPRLDRIQVELLPDPSNRRRARGRLEAVLRLEWGLERVSFELALEAAAFTVGRISPDPGDGLRGASPGETICMPQN